MESTCWGVSRKKFLLQRSTCFTRKLRFLLCLAINRRRRVWRCLEKSLDDRMHVKKSKNSSVQRRATAQNGRQHVWICRKLKSPLVCFSDHSGGFPLMRYPFISWHFCFSKFRIQVRHILHNRRSLQVLFKFINLLSVDRKNQQNSLFKQFTVTSRLCWCSETVVNTNTNKEHHQQLSHHHRHRWSKIWGQSDNVTCKVTIICSVGCRNPCYGTDKLKLTDGEYARSEIPREGMCGKYHSKDYNFSQDIYQTRQRKSRKSTKAHSMLFSDFRENWIL